MDNSLIEETLDIYHQNYGDITLQEAATGVVMDYLDITNMSSVEDKEMGRILIQRVVDRLQR